MNMELQAVWKNDCCGKKDYDGPVCSISTRYWPRGGSVMILDTSNSKGLVKYDDGSKPSAHSSLLFGCPRNGPYIHLSEKNFEGETFEEVAEQVEKWAQEQMNKAETVLKAAFPDWKEP